MDVMHRVMNERMKCFLPHGHTYLFELTFGFSEMQSIGYQIDFKEIKRVGCQWIDDILDHGAILNPKDQVLIDAVQKLDGKLWLMSLNGKGEYCNPSVENIAKEIFLAIEILFEDYDDLWLETIRLYETPNCFTDCSDASIGEQERISFYEVHGDEIRAYKKEKGVVEYDDRKCIA